MKRTEKRLKKKTVFVFSSAGNRNSHGTDPTTSSILITITGGIADANR
ncbi:hypothetical protein ACTJKC_04035 [Pedobacter sp. 22226]